MEQPIPKKPVIVKNTRIETTITGALELPFTEIFRCLRASGYEIPEKDADIEIETGDGYGLVYDDSLTLKWSSKDVKNVIQ